MSEIDDLKAALTVVEAQCAALQTDLGRIKKYAKGLRLQNVLSMEPSEGIALLKSFELLAASNLAYNAEHRRANAIEEARQALQQELDELERQQDTASYAEEAADPHDIAALLRDSYRQKRVRMQGFYRSAIEKLKAEREARRALQQENEQLREQRDEARRYGERLYTECAGNARQVTCVYCGHVFAADTPASQDERLNEHVRVCEKHPLRAEREARQALQTTLRKIAELDNVRDPNERPAMVVVLDRWNECLAIAKAALHASEGAPK